MKICNRIAIGGDDNTATATVTAGSKDCNRTWDRFRDGVNPLLLKLLKFFGQILVERFIGLLSVHRVLATEIQQRQSCEYNASKPKAIYFGSRSFESHFCSVRFTR